MKLAQSTPCWLYLSPGGHYRHRTLPGLLYHIASARATQPLLRRRDDRVVVTERRPDIAQILFDFAIDAPDMGHVALAEEVFRTRALVRRAEAARDRMIEQLMDGLAWARGQLGTWRRAGGQPATDFNDGTGP